MESKKEVKRLLQESGNIHLFNDVNYKISTQLTQIAERADAMLRRHFKNLEGQRE